MLKLVPEPFSVLVAAFQRLRAVGNWVTVSTRLHWMTRNLIFQPLSSSQHEEVSQPDLHCPICSVRLLTPLSPPCPFSTSGNLVGPRSLESVLHFFFWPSLLLLAHLGGSMNCSKVPLCGSVFRDPFWSRSNQVVRTGKAGRHVISLFPASQAQPVGSRGRIPFCAITALRQIDDIVSSEELSSVTDFRFSYSIENQQKILHKRYNNDTCFKPMCSTLQLSWFPGNCMT